MPSPTPITPSLPGAAELNADIVAFLAERLRSMGSQDGGLYNFYESRIANGKGLYEYDLRLAEYCATHLRHCQAFMEIGCGVGQLVLLLASLGLAAYGLERDARRLACFRALLAHLAPKYPMLARKAVAVEGSLPIAVAGLEPARTVLLANCLVFTAVGDEELRLVRAMKDYAAAIIDLTRFVEVRRTPEAKARLCQLLRAEGFSEPVQLGPPGQWGEGEFVLITAR